MALWGFLDDIIRGTFITTFSHLTKTQLWQTLVRVSKHLLRSDNGAKRVPVSTEPEWLPTATVPGYLAAHLAT